MTDIKLQIPATMEMKLYITDGDGNSGAVTYSFPIGKVPTLEDVRAVIPSILDQVGRNFRTLTKRETLERWTLERTGENIHVPTGDEFDDEV